MQMLQLDDVAIGYAERMLHAHISIACNTGEILAVLGRNGSGKSTLLRCIAGLQPVLSGTVLLRNTPIEKYNLQERSRIISIVLSDNRKYAGVLTVREILELSRAPHTGWLHTLTPKDKATIDEAMELFNIQSFAGRRLYTLSDGELQTVMIARAFVQETDIIALDEPTAHLDIFNQAEIFKHLHLLARQYEKTIIIATHAIEQCLHIADLLLLLNTQNRHLAGVKQQVLEKGGIPQFFASPDFEFDKETMRFNQKKI